MDLRITPDPDAAAREAATWIGRQLGNAVRRRGAATMAVSGGRTPAAMFRLLAELDVPWRAVTVYQVDERVAPDGDPARNAGLLDLLPAGVRRRMPVTAADLRAAARRYAAALPERLDVVHLGLGDDGHTASWPPGDAVVAAHTTVAITAPYRGHVRMTLTPVAVNAARHRVVLATGADKANAVRQWLLDDPAVPVQRVRRRDAVVVLDRSAAAHLPMPPG